METLYRKYRPKSLDEVVGQAHITNILKKALKAGNIAHAYLLTGPRGVGKTSIARILAHEINELKYSDESTHLDIIEIDAASNNSVEDIRDLRGKVMIAPSSAKKKIYIIDEVHMLSKSAFNALLKTLEEPPSHVVFILATTDADKLPSTILSRVQRFNFRAISEADIKSHLQSVAKSESIAIEDDALALISHNADGAIRDALSALDQVKSLSSDSITLEQVEQVLGVAPADIIAKLLDAHELNDLKALTATLDRAKTSGVPASSLISQLVQTIHSRLLNQPQLLPLLGSLLANERGAWPYTRLLVALTHDMNFSRLPQAEPAVKTNVTETKAAKTLPSTTLKEVVRESRVAEPEVPYVKPAKIIAKPLKNVEPLAADKSVKMPDSSTTQELDWGKLIEAVKEQSTSLSSMLAKKSYGLSGSTLTIYASNKFIKGQLERSMQIITSALGTINVKVGEIIIIPATKPPKDDRTAQIIDIMGGGEEVNI
ncbi:MAG: DNA polymerase III subunit gamma/tau [Candidatus Saccharimonas sp.]